jgi:hypothetical protein
MLSRTATFNMSGRASAMRRQRRRSHHQALYCATNGCASFLELDAATGVATCPVCGYTRHVG